MRVIAAGDAGAFARLAAEEVARVIEAAVADRGSASVALAGGSTPRAVHEALSAPPWAERIPWPAVEIWFGDERCVPPEDPESNYRMARETLLDRVPVDPVRVHRIEGERPDRDRAAEEYGAALPEALDLIVLGIGEDGHTASLFPGSPALEETVRKAVAIRGPKPPPWRITVTPPVLCAAREVIVLASGESKSKAVARALSDHGDPKETPARIVRDRTWIITSGFRPQATGFRSEDGISS